ncbi:MAG TPA: hypothetical protein VHP11_17955 [Tepidisphaeraceae bacterium]|nr:hypothetical protein [Tepidisphaeraceae bacterium]
MLLLHPAWLMLLAPWAALVALCLREFRPKVVVPFLGLWPAEPPGESKQRFWRVPPWAVVLLLLSLLLIVVALAQPALRRDRPALQEMTVVVDRGITMLAGGRLRNAAQSLQKACEGLLSPDATIRVEEVGSRADGEVVSAAGLWERLSHPVSAMRVQDELRPIAARVAARGGTVVLLSDMVDPPSGAVRCVPAGRPENVGIVSVTVNQGKCLLTLRNDSSRTNAHVKLAGTGNRAVEQDLQLPARGGTSGYTLDVPSELLKVTLAEADDLEDDNVRWLVPRYSANLVLAAGTPDRVQRFARSYAAGRAARPASRTVRITGWENLPENDAIVIAQGQTRVNLTQNAWPDHEILRDVRIPKTVLAADRGAMRNATAAGWSVLLGSPEQALLAVDDKHRRVWVGFEPASEQDVPDWLILLTNIADHLAETPHSTSRPRPLGDGWRRLEPGMAAEGEAGTRYGVYQRGETLVAINVAAPVLRECERTDIRSKILAEADAQSRVDLAKWLWLAAASLAAVAAFFVRADREIAKVS